MSSVKKKKKKLKKNLIFGSAILDAAFLKTFQKAFIVFSKTAENKDEKHAGKYFNESRKKKQKSRF